MLIIQSSLTRTQILINCLCLALTCYRYASCVRLIHTNHHMNNEKERQSVCVIELSIQCETSSGERRELNCANELSKKEKWTLGFWFRFRFTTEFIYAYICVIVYVTYGKYALLRNAFAMNFTSPCHGRHFYMIIFTEEDENNRKRIFQLKRMLILSNMGFDLVHPFYET